jgi:uncharacterized protein YggE
MRPLPALALAALLAAPLPALAEGTITVTGEGVVQTVPDQATVTLGVNTNAPTAAEAMAANSTAIAAVIERLKAAGVDGADMQTSNLFLSANWGGYDGSGTTPRVIDYAASNMLNVRLREIAALGEVLDAAVTDGANAVNGITFGLADPKAAMDEARTRAVADARARAGVLAAAAGVELGAIVSITEGGAFNGPSPVFRADAASAPVPIETGEIAITANVTVTWELAP